MRKRPDEARPAMTAERVKARVTAAQVADYLRRHPDFLARHPDVLDHQVIPSRRRGDAVLDLQQFMVERLRRDIARLRADQDDLVANSRDNLSTQDRIHKAALALLAADEIGRFVETVTTDLAMLLDVDTVVLCLEATDLKIPLLRADGVQLLPVGSVDRLIGQERSSLLRDDVVGDASIYGAAAGLVRSDALIRLQTTAEAPIGLMGFGTRHPGYFNPGQGTELLLFLARIVEHCMRPWMKPSPRKR